MNVLRNASLFALLSLALAFVPLVMAVIYAWRPSERPLARPSHSCRCSSASPL